MRYVAIPTDMARHYQSGGLDANGQVPERVVLDQESGPCRHCLRMISKGAGMLTLSHRPFSAPQPYAELGPVFLCAEPCAQGGGEALPEMLGAPDHIVRGYGADDRIVYGTGGVVVTKAIPARAEALFANPQIAYLHIRSARNNCYQCRIDRE